MRMTAPLIGMTLAALALAGCSTTPPPDSGKTPDSSSVVSASPTPETTEAPEASEFGATVKSPRGNLVKEVGQLAGIGSSSSDAMVARFVVTDIVFDMECGSEFADPPANGHYLGVHINVETTPELAAEEIPSIYFSQYDWQAYDADGKRLNDPVGNAMWCLSSAQELPMEIGPGQSVSGWMVLDVAATTGSIVLAMGGPTGWEWAY